MQIASSRIWPRVVKSVSFNDKLERVRAYVYVSVCACVCVCKSGCDSLCVYVCVVA